jgi:hypothetical protein
MHIHTRKAQLSSKSGALESATGVNATDLMSRSRPEPGWDSGRRYTHEYNMQTACGFKPASKAATSSYHRGNAFFSQRCQLSTQAKLSGLQRRVAPASHGCCCHFKFKSHSFECYQRGTNSCQTGTSTMDAPFQGIPSGVSSDSGHEPTTGDVAYCVCDASYISMASSWMVGLRPVVYRGSGPLHGQVHAMGKHPPGHSCA